MLHAALTSGEIMMAGDNWIIRDEDDNEIAAMIDGDEAQARLFAAAPDLLEACEASQVLAVEGYTRKSAEKLGVLGEFWERGPSALQHHVAQLRLTAIAKARGAH